MLKFQKFRILRSVSRNPRRALRQATAFFSLALIVFAVVYFIIPLILNANYGKKTGEISVPLTVAVKDENSLWTASHLPTPQSVKAIYMTSCVAGSKELRGNLVKLIDETELNSVVIDIKDYSGTLSFVPDEPSLKDFVSTRCYASDMASFIESLHQKNIYVIGRITVFQDPFLVKRRPDLAVKKKSDGTAWKDFKGISFTDPGAKEVWDHAVLIAKASHNIGFDELNFDYIRFPSDGPMKDIYFSWSGEHSKPAVLKDFFKYLSEKLLPTGAALSADLFGMTTTNIDDLNIGQVLENALPYFDYIAPMVYPSHYPTRFMGFVNPADKPYEVVKFSMDSAVRRVLATTTLAKIPGVAALASTTPPLYPKESFPAKKLRPWLQDFNLGATYTAEMVRKQIQATYDSGLDSWMLWSASNRYTKDALLAE